ncbi:MAG: serine/threonine protein kinase [Planctomycetota bacterium]|nr:MAG: serine/threonine protein kinase [Planctomycetota bacterium]REK25843.1 MAG: serine/threonine protein kinase [Planctomycetota bacterium]REK37122.1 MAG: serine/threonine protein kinase [Planctomycetota bacterium]
MSQIHSCPKCGAELPENAPRGLCPKCLIAAGFDSRDESMNPGDSSTGHTTSQPRPFQPPDAVSLEPLFPQLETLELVGHGGMGAVYRARQKKLDRIVALKIIRPESADDHAFAERFNREARTLARLNHSHIVAVYDFGEVTISHDDSSTPRTLFYFLMEFVDGANLRELIDGGDLRSDQALAIVAQICEALQFAHEAGVVHRDIKPENILVDTRGQVKIADFGLAKLAERSPEEFTLTGTHQVMGTPRYMAPEQMEGSHGVDHRADIYSLGVVFYEMLTGQVPAGHFDPPSKKVQIDVRLDEVVLRSLAREPDRRYQQASEVKTDVEVISQCSGTDVAPTVRGHARQNVDAGDRQNATGTPVDDVTARLVRQVQKVGSSLFWLAVTEWVLVTLTLLIGSAVIYFWDGAPSEWKKALRDDDLTGGIVAIEFWTTLHAVTVLTSSLLLKRLRCWSLGVASALLVMLFPPANLVGLPIGIWSLVMLSSREVREAFRFVNQGTLTLPLVDTDDAIETESDAGFPWSAFWFEFSILAALFGIVTFTLVWSQHGGALAALALPWMFVGGCGAATRDDPENAAANVNLVVATLVSVVLIAGGVVIEGTPVPLTAFGACLAGFLFGTGAGTASREARKARKAAEEYLKAHADDADDCGDLEQRSGNGSEEHAESNLSKSAEPEPRGTLGRAWDTWWQQRTRWQINTAITILAGAHLACMAAMLTLRGGFEVYNGRQQFVHQVGMPSPWYVYTTWRFLDVIEFDSQFNWLSSSLLIGIGGLAMWSVCWQVLIARAQPKRPPRVLSPPVVTGMWIVAAIAFAGLGRMHADQLLRNDSRGGEDAAESVPAETPNLPSDRRVERSLTGAIP